MIVLLVVICSLTLVLGIEVFAKYVTEATLNIKLDLNIISLSLVTSHTESSQHTMAFRAIRNSRNTRWTQKLGEIFQVMNSSAAL